MFYQCLAFPSFEGCYKLLQVFTSQVSQVFAIAKDVLSKLAMAENWKPVRTLPVAPLWCDLGFLPISRGFKIIWVCAVRRDRISGCCTSEMGGVEWGGVGLGVEEF